MFGHKATELINHIKREQGDLIPPYKYELVEEIMKENNELYAENLRTSQCAQDDTDISEKEIMTMQIRHTPQLWNKRCIIAYHYERLNRLKKLRWEYGNNLPREIVQNLTRDELEWFTKYNENLFSYMNALNDGRGLDLTLHMKPPKRLYVKFKCLKNYGQFELDGGTCLLRKDDLYYLPLKQCEKLVQQGILEHIKD